MTKMTIEQWQSLWADMQISADGYRAQGDIASADLIEESIALSKAAQEKKNAQN